MGKVSAVAEGGKRGNVEHIGGCAREGVRMEGGEVEDSGRIKQRGDLESGDAVDEGSLGIAGAVQCAAGEDICGGREIGGTLVEHTESTEEGGAGEAGGRALREGIKKGSSPLPVSGADIIGTKEGGKGLEAIIAPDFVAGRVFKGVEGVGEMFGGQEVVADEEAGDVVFEGEEIHRVHALRRIVMSEKRQKSGGVIANLSTAELVKPGMAFHKRRMDVLIENLSNGLRGVGRTLNQSCKDR